MKKFLLSGVAALGLIAAGAASAADLPSRKGPVVAPVYVPVFTWTGCYVGAHVGYAWGTSKQEYAGTRAGVPDPFLPVGFDLTGNYNTNEVVGGGQGGRDVFGDSVKTEYFGTVRARVGVAFDRFLPYVTGGWAYGNVKTSIPGLAFSSDRTHTGGWAVGAGVEYAFTNNLIGGVEYLYVDLGEKNIAGFGTKVGTDFSVVRARLSYKF